MKNLSAVLCVGVVIGLAGHSLANHEVWVDTNTVTATAANNNSNPSGDEDFPGGWEAGIEQTIDGSGLSEDGHHHANNDDESGGFRRGAGIPGYYSEGGRGASLGLTNEDGGRVWEAGRFWLNENTAVPHGPALSQYGPDTTPWPNGQGGLNPGTVATGNVWGRWDFAATDLADMRIWNYGGCCGRAFNAVTIEASADGGSTYSTVFAGLLDQTPGGEGFLLSELASQADDHIEFTGFPAGTTTVVMTAGGASGTIGPSNLGLSEVRFVVPEPATLGLLALGSFVLLRRKRA